MNLSLVGFFLIDWLFSAWWLWLIVAAVFLVLTFQNMRKKSHVQSTSRTLLLLEIPRENDKKELSSEQMFAALHGILRPKSELVREGSLQDHISFEMASHERQIRFYVSTPTHLKNFVEGQIYAQYPTVQIHELEEDYADREIEHSVIHSSEIVLTDNDMLPIKTFPSFEVDPLAAITATLAKLDKTGEDMWIQLLARPIDDSWHKKGSRFIESIKGKTTFFDGGYKIFGWIAQLFEALWRPPEENGESGTVELSERDKSRIAGVEEKTKKLGYDVKIRILYLGNDKSTARLRMQGIVGSFKQFNSTNLNGFMATKTRFDHDALAEYRARHFIDSGMTLNIEELASVYHLPHTSVETPNIVWARTKTAEPPSNLPSLGSVPNEDLSPFGITNFRGTNTQFGIRRTDRGRHMYIIGQTGTGKSGLLELLTISDIYGNEGFAVIDPHGDYAVHMLQMIPAHRMDDVVYFNPADTEFPIGFNPLEVTDPALKNHISSELVGVLKRMFESWGPRLEYILRYTILALLDYPNATMLDITRVLTEKPFRNEVLSYVSDPVVKNFWVNEFATWNDKFAAEAVAPVLNKIGAFTANPMIRNIVGQSTSSMNIRHVMDNGKILIVNLSRGLVGEDNAAVLGALMVTKIQLAAMSRADIANLADRRPFYLYVDEFQNFATDSFATILSEARKYGLNLTIANQYISQMSPEVKDAVFGNVGSLIAFRVGAEDAGELEKYFAPYFSAQDLIQMNNRYFIGSLTIGGEKAPAFSASTVTLPMPQEDHVLEIVDRNRQLYGKPRTEVEASIRIEPERKFRPEHKANTSNKPKAKPSKSSKAGPKKSSGSKSKSKKPNKKQKPKSKKSGGKLDQNKAVKLR